MHPDSKNSCHRVMNFIRSRLIKARLPRQITDQWLAAYDFERTALDPSNQPQKSQSPQYYTDSASSSTWHYQYDDGDWEQWAQWWDQHDPSEEEQWEQWEQYNTQWWTPTAMSTTSQEHSQGTQNHTIGTTESLTETKRVIDQLRQLPPEKINTILTSTSEYLKTQLTWIEAQQQPSHHWNLTATLRYCTQTTTHEEA